MTRSDDIKALFQSLYERCTSDNMRRDLCALRALLTSGEDAMDAERYRWLRHGDNDEEVMCWTRFGNVFLLRNEDLDAAIDRARLAGKEKADG